MTVLAFIAVLVFLAVAFPRVFYDQFIWKYLWGPIVADAMGVYSTEYNGVRAFSGYNVVNTLTYAILTVGALYVAYHYLKGKAGEGDIKKFIFALFPLIIYGSVARVLEDMGLFLSLHLQAMFITPLIYIQILILFLCVIFASMRFSASRYPIPVIVAIIACALSVMLLQSSLSMRMSYLYLVLVSAVFIGLSTRFREWYMQGFLFSLFLLSLALYYVVSYALSAELRPMVLLGSLSLPVLVTLLIFALPLPSYFKEAQCLLAVFSQMLDATATYIGISHFGYYEKHVLPSFMMGTAGPWVMIPIKLAVVLIVIYAIKDEDETVKDIALMLIMILGMAPGTRDMLRITLGV